MYLQFINQTDSFTQEKNKKKRIENCFISFRNEMLEFARNVGNNMTMKEFSKEVSQLWKNTPESKKDEYKRKYEINREISKNSKSMLIQEIIDLFNRLSQLLIAIINDSSEMSYYENISTILNLKIRIMIKVEEYIDNVFQFEEKSTELLLKVYYDIYEKSFINNLILFDDFMEWYLL
uniref:MATA-HMG n=2 Tax=Rhizophagus irregularis TaxID=588596 RepID=A0A1B1EUU4_9GLOM|nr:MATA-HMG [Rhizophagus irregularis]